MICLMYHRLVSEEDYAKACGTERIFQVPVDEFEKQIKYLAKSATIISLSDLVDKYYRNEPIPPGTVCITFDDGYKDNYTFAYPILLKYGATATVFLTTGYIGNKETFSSHKTAFALWNTGVKKFHLDSIGNFNLKYPQDRLSAINKIGDVIKYLPEEERNRLTDSLLAKLNIKFPVSLQENLMLTWEEIGGMHRDGIEFGAHTVTHPILSRVPLATAKKEIASSKRAIEQNLQHPCTLFAYPNGTSRDVNEDSIEIVKNSGFTSAVSTVPRLLKKRIEDPFWLSRISAGTNHCMFKASYSGFYPDLLSITK